MEAFMRKYVILTVFFVITILLTSCASTDLKDAKVVKTGNLNDYQYVLVNSTETLTSSVGTTINGTYVSQGKTVNPKDIISGYLIKKGYIILDSVNEETKNRTMIVNYGESGRRELALGYTTEVTLQFISADTKQLICTTTAEGLGETEADDIKNAITRALDALFE